MSTNKIPQINQRQIGTVIIIDLKGELIGPWAIKARERLAQIFSKVAVDSILINLKEVETIDSLGVKAIMENFPVRKKSGLISGRISVMEMFTRISELQKINVFQNEEDLTAYFGVDFIQRNPDADFPDKRESSRLKTAIPLEFWYENTAQQRVTFAAIVTDLSEGGVFAEYLDVEAADNFQAHLTPNELNDIEMRLKLPDEEHIFVKGKVARTVITGEQIGIGVRFIELKQDDSSKIKKFLND